MVKVYLQGAILKVEVDSTQNYFLNRNDVHLLMDKGIYYIHYTADDSVIRLGSFSNILNGDDNGFVDDTTVQAYLTNIVGPASVIGGDLSPAVAAKLATMEAELQKLSTAAFTDLIKQYGADGRVRFDDGTKHFYFEVKQPDGSWVKKAEIGGSLIIDTVKFEESATKPTVKANELGLYSKQVDVPNHGGAPGTHKALRPFFVLETGDEVAVVGVWNDQLRIPQKDGSNEYAAFKSEITPAKIVDYITSELGNDDWKSGGTGSGVPQSVYDDIASNKAELARLKTNTTQAAETIYTYRGKEEPTDMDDAKHKAYYISIFGLEDNNFTFDMPDPADTLEDGAIFCIDNNDKENFFMLVPPMGQTVNGKTDNIKVRPSSIVFLVKTGTDWNIAFSGYIPNNLDTIIQAVKAKVPQGGLTIDEIQAQLKDRLHTFREIQTEFDDQLHTYNEIEAELISRGYNRGMSAEWALSDTNSVDPQVFTGQTIEPNQRIETRRTSGSKYFVVALSKELSELVDGFLLDNVVKEFDTVKYVKASRVFELLISRTPIDMSIDHTILLNLSVDNSAPGGIEIDDGVTNKAGITKVNLKGAYLSEVYDDSEEVTVKAVTTWEQQEDGTGGRVDEVKVEEPLQVYIDPDTKVGENERVKLRVKRNYFELAKPPGYLAYLQENEEVMGRVKPGDTGVRQGPVWFDDIVVGGNSPFIEVDKIRKGLGIQDYIASDDPNVSGGVPTLIAFRIAMKGVAPNDGFVEILLKKTDEGTVIQDGDYLKDVNDSPIGVRRNYKKGDELGILDAMAIYMAKGLTKFQCLVEHSFVDDGVMLEDRTEGASGIMIQALTKDYATGDALLQFENDTNQNIEFTKHWNGDDIFNIAWALTYDRAESTITPGTGQTTIDGLHLHNSTNIKVGVADKTLTIKDDGVNTAYFNLGKIFTAEKTYMLRGKDLDVKGTLQDKDSGYRIYMAKWLGTPDAYTTKIITDLANDTPVLEANWELDGSTFISEDVVVGEHDFMGTLTVPMDANNFAVIIVPVEKQSPLTFKMKGFEVNVSKPFYGWVVEAPELINEKHLMFSDRHANFVAGNPGYQSFRYTINNVPQGMPMPIGVLKSGKADIVLDQSVNQVSGSSNHIYEGALKFNADGKATIDTQVYLWSEQDRNVVAQTKFWWSKVSADGNTFTPIPLSEYTVGIKGATKSINKMPRFELDVQAGDRIALLATTDRADGAYIESVSGDPNPMVNVKIDFDEITEDESKILARIQSIDDDIVISDTAKAQGWYIELDVSPEGVPSLSPKKRNP